MPLPQNRSASSSAYDHGIVDDRGPGEWIVNVPERGRPLHVYRLGPADWLVSEVGRGNEGRGPDLKHALAALSARVWPAEWSEAVSEVLGSNQQAT